MAAQEIREHEVKSMDLTFSENVRSASMPRSLIHNHKNHSLYCTVYLYQHKKKEFEIVGGAADRQTDGEDDDDSAGDRWVSLLDCPQS